MINIKHDISNNRFKLSFDWNKHFIFRTLKIFILRERVLLLDRYNRKANNIFNVK